VHLLRHILYRSNEFVVSSEQISHQSLLILGAQTCKYDDQGVQFEKKTASKYKESAPHAGSHKLKDPCMLRLDHAFHFPRFFSDFRREISSNSHVRTLRSSPHGFAFRKYRTSVTARVVLTDAQDRRDQEQPHKTQAKIHFGRVVLMVPPERSNAPRAQPPPTPPTPPLLQRRSI